MSWFGNTLIPVVQDIYWDAEDYPADPEEVAADLRKGGHTKEADYVAKAFTKATIVDLYETCGLVQRAEEAERHNTCWK